MAKSQARESLEETRALQRLQAKMDAALIKSGAVLPPGTAQPAKAQSPSKPGTTQPNS